MELYLDCAVGGILNFSINSLYTDFDFNDVESTEVFDCERFASVMFSQHNLVFHRFECLNYSK